MCNQILSPIMLQIIIIIIIVTFILENILPLLFFEPDKIIKQNTATIK